MTGTRRAALLAAAVCLFPIVVLAIALTAATTNNSGAQPGPGSGAAVCGGPATSARTLSSTQTGNAQIIYNVSASDGLPPQAAVIAIATAMQESSLENIPYGDRDSLGLFQQRPSQEWGAPAQIMQPVYAAQKFYSVLTAVPGWQSLPVTVAAQDVQQSAYPDAYARWQPLAQSLVSQFSGTTCALDNGRGVAVTGSMHLPRGFTLPPGTPPPVVTAIAYAAAQLGKPYIWDGTGPTGYDCSGLVMMAYRAADITLPRTTFQQVNSGTPVYSLSQLKPGDLLFSAGSDGSPSNPGHVGIFIGSGLVLEAPQSGERVQVERLDGGYWNRRTTAIRRITRLCAGSRSICLPRSDSSPLEPERMWMDYGPADNFCIYAIAYWSPGMADRNLAEGYIGAIA